MGKVTLGTVCMLAEHNPSKNLETIVRFIEEAADNNIQLLVFPECALQGYLWTWNWKTRKFIASLDQTDYFRKTAETIPGPSTNHLTKYAAQHNIVIQLGMVEKVITNKIPVLYNSDALLGPQGVIGKYRKIHSIAERAVFQSGTKLHVFDTSIGKIGPLICKDLQYPEASRVLALDGAQVITLSTASGMNPKTDYSGYRYDLLTRSTAILNSIWIVVADQVGTAKRSDEACFGHSRIIDPHGTIIAGIGYEEGLVTAKVNLARINPNRFIDRYPPAYHAISSKGL